MRPSRLFVCGSLSLLVASLGACTGDHEVRDAHDIDAWLLPDAAIDAMADDSGIPVTLSHTSVPRTVEPGGEVNDLCESFTLHNATVIYVNAVTFDASPGMHHSNWLYVPGGSFAGPDGTWPCASRGYDQGVAAALGGVLFAQSTQATHQVQQFPPNVALPLPPGSRVIGQVHMLNTTSAPLDVSTHLEIHPIPRDEVQTRLSGLYLEFNPISLAPHTRSLSTTSCDIGAQHERLLGRPIDFHLYYGMPHYHALGRGMRVSVIGGPNDGHDVFATNQLIGEPDGHTLMPAYDLTGATGLRITCDFDNPRDVPVHYGVGDQEMCIFLGFTESSYQWAGIAGWDSPVTTTTDSATGTIVHDAPCNNVYGLISHAHDR